MLVLVLCSLVAILAYPTRQFMNQRAQISDQRVKAEQARQQVEQLKTEWARWQDPMFVKAQARERLHYALPGETPFVSIDPTPRPRPPARRRRVPAGRREGGQALVRRRLGLGGRGCRPCPHPRPVWGSRPVRRLQN